MSQNLGIADDYGQAKALYIFFGNRFQNDLRADAGRVSHRDADSRFQTTTVQEEIIEQESNVGYVDLSNSI